MSNMKHYSIIIFVVALAAAAAGFFLLRGPAALKDGTYEASASGAFGDTNVTLTIREGRIADCKLTAIDKEGRVKDEHYGEGSGEANHRLAQIALQGMRQYPGMLIEAQDSAGDALQALDKLDAVSGATVTFREFQAAAKEALEKAR